MNCELDVGANANKSQRVMPMAEISASAPRPKNAEGTEPPTVSSEVLLAGSRQLIILHGRERYRLFLTSSNKLILTK
jgi:hemin uptake protein HemP